MINALETKLEPVIILPVHDIGFKGLFTDLNDTDHELLKDLTSSILETVVEDIEIINSEISPNQKSEKGPRMDLRFTSNTCIYDFEMQKRCKGNEIERAVLYASASLYTQPLKGKDYSEISPVHHVFFLAENSVRIQNSSDLFELCSVVNLTPLTDLVKITMINMKKIIDEITDVHQMTKLQKWCLFLLGWPDENHSGMQVLYQEEIFRKANELMKKLNENQIYLLNQMKDILDEMDRKTELVQEREQGLKQGLQIGAENTKNQMMKAISLLAMGRSIEEIVQKTGMVEEDVIELAVSMNPVFFSVAEKQSTYSVTDKHTY